MRAKLFSVEGKFLEEIEMPPCFETEYRPDLIRKAFSVVRANRRQPYGVKATAGKDYVAESWGPGRGMSRIPRLDSGRAARAPGTVKGRRAHPPKVEKIWEKKINRKEMTLAKLSALSACVNDELVRNRGHKFEAEIPVVVEDKFEEFQKTKEVVNALKNLKLYDDIERARNGKHIRAGKGKRRGRKYKVPKSLLIIASNKEKLKKAVSNLLGVDLVTPDEMNIEHLAPGGHAGRLTLFTLSALQRIGEKYGGWGT